MSEEKQGPEAPQPPSINKHNKASTGGFHALCWPLICTLFCDEGGGGEGVMAKLMGPYTMLSINI